MKSLFREREKVKWILWSYFRATELDKLNPVSWLFQRRGEKKREKDRGEEKRLQFIIHREWTINFCFFLMLHKFQL
jgi:hypothetical protein